MTLSTESLLKSFDKALRSESEEELFELFNGKDGKAIAKTKDSYGQYPLHRIVKDDVFFLPIAYKLISKLLSLFPEAIDTCDKDGKYALYVACANTRRWRDGSNPDAVLCLLKARPEHASKQEASTKKLPLHYACITQPTHVIKALVEAYPDALRIMDAEGNLPAHFAAGNKKCNNMEYLYSQCPEAFLHKNKRFQLPISLCYKDDGMFLHLTRLCPKSLFHINERNTHDSELLSPLVDYLVKKQNFPRCRADMVRKVFHEVFQCLLAKDEEVKNKLRSQRDEALHLAVKLEEKSKNLESETRTFKMRTKQYSRHLENVLEVTRDERAKLSQMLKDVQKERDEALSEKEKLEERWKNFSIEIRDVKERLKKEEADSKSAHEKLSTIQTERERLTAQLNIVENQIQKLIKEGQKLDEALLPLIGTTGHNDSNAFPMEALKAFASFLNKQLELAKSHDNEPCEEQSREQLLVEAFLSNPNLSRPSLTNFIKSTYRELLKLDAILPIQSCTATTVNQNPHSTVVVDESPENRPVTKRARVSLD